VRRAPLQSAGLPDMAGHGWFGAGAGCVIGRHEANKRESVKR